MPLHRYLLALLLVLVTEVTPARAQNPYFFSLDGRFEQTLVELQQKEYLDILVIDQYVKIAERHGNTFMTYYYNNDSILWKIEMKKNYDWWPQMRNYYWPIKHFLVMAGGAVVSMSTKHPRSGLDLQHVISINQDRVYRFIVVEHSANNTDFNLTCTWVHRAPQSALRDFDFVVLGDLEREPSGNEAENQPPKEEKGRK